MSPPWPDVSLGEVCEFKYGKSLPEAKRAGGNVPVFGSNGIVGSHDVAITEGATIIVGRKGSFGEVNVSLVPCWPIDTTYYIDASATKSDLRWLAYRLSGLGLRRLNRAAAVPGLNREDAYRQRLLLPPLREQRRIAEVLDRAEELRAKRRAALAQLDTLTQAIFLDLFGDPVTNPKGWPRTALRDLCTATGEYGANLTSKEFDSNLPRYVRITDINESGELDSQPVSPSGSRNDWDAYRLEAGDVLFARSGATAGKTYMHRASNGECVFAGYLIRFRPNFERVTPEFLFHYTRTGSYRSWVLNRQRVVAQPNINARQYGLELQLPVPPLPLQQGFASRVDAVEKLKGSHRASLAELDALFASLQHRAFRGEL